MGGDGNKALRAKERIPAGWQQQQQSELMQDVGAEAAEQRLFVAWAVTGVGSVAESSGLSGYQIREHCKQSHAASAPCISS